MPERVAWLQREARRQAARPDLFDALLSGRSFAYARHRLGFMALRMLLRTGLHALEIGLLMAAFVPFEYLAPLIVVRALCSVAGAAHWGALEVLRAQVREAVRLRQLGTARSHVERWLGLTLWAAGALLLVTLALEVTTIVASASIRLRDVFGLACVLRLGLESAMRVLHSGVFALRRVHRPLWSSVAPDVLELAILAAGFGQLGVWAIPVATLAGGLCDAGLACVYVRRAYVQRRLQLPSLARAFGAARRLDAALLGAAGRHALANVSLQLDGLVLLALVHAEQTAGGSGAFATLYYVLRPLMAASTHWLRTFYFDLKLIEGAGLRAFRPQLVRFLERLAVGWAVLLAILTLLLARGLLGMSLALEFLLLVPFFVVRSAFALVQLLAFGAGELRRLFWFGLVVLAGLGLLRALGLHDLELLLGITLLLAGVVVFASRSRPTDAAALLVGEGVLDLGPWLACLARGTSMQLAVLRVNTRAAKVGSILRGLRAAYPEAALTRWGRRYVMVALPERSVVCARELIVRCGGSLARVWLSRVAAPVALFDQAKQAGELPDGWQQATEQGRAAGGLPELEREFRAQFAAGEIVILGSGRGLTTRAVNAAVMHALVRTIRARSRGRHTRSERALPFELAVFAPCGQAAALFLADTDAPGFRAFRNRVELASLYASWPLVFAPPEAYTVDGHLHALPAGVR